jgi:hypothetical protein
MSSVFSEMCFVRGLIRPNTRLSLHQAEAFAAANPKPLGKKALKRQQWEERQQQLGGGAAGSHPQHKKHKGALDADAAADATASTAGGTAAETQVGASVDGSG